MRNRFTPDEEPTLLIADRSDAEIRIRRRFSHSCRQIKRIRSNFLRKFEFHRIGNAHSPSQSLQRREVDVEYAPKQFDDENRGWYLAYASVMLVKLEIPRKSALFVMHIISN